MSEQANYFKIGLFVIVTTGMLLVGVAILGVADQFKEGVLVETYIRESVEGLSVGSAVKHRGVAIGRVSGIGFLGDQYKQPSPADGTNGYINIIVVQMELNPEALKGFTDPGNLGQLAERGLRTQLNQSGLTGPMYIDLAYFDPAEYPIEPLSWQPDNQYVPSVPSTIQYLIDQVETVLTNMSQLDIQSTFARLDQLLQSTTTMVEGVDTGDLQGQVGALIDEVRATNQRVQTLLSSDAVTTFVNDLPNISSSTLAATERLQGVLKHPAVDQTVTRLPSITDHLDSASRRLDQLLNSPEVEQTLVELPNAVRRAERAADRVADMAAGIEGLTVGQREQIEAVLENVRLLTAQAGELVQRLENNPSGVVFGSAPDPINPASP